MHLGVVGLGPIGEAVARLGAALGMRVTGLRRTPRGDEPCEARPMTALAELLPEVDALVIAVPLTETTRNLIDARALALLKPGAYVINVARGEVMDEGALVEALRDGRDVLAACPEGWAARGSMSSTRNPWPRKARFGICPT